MIIELPTRDLQVGMYVELVKCSEKEFARRRFLIRNSSELQAVLGSPADMVLVNKALSDGSVFAKEDRSGDDQAEALKKVGAISSKISEVFRGVHEAGLIDIDASMAVAADVAELALHSSDCFVLVTRLKNAGSEVYLHSVAVAGLMAIVADQLGYDEPRQREFAMAGLVHDIGKLFVPPEILNKKGHLSLDERRVIQRHPQAGYLLLKKSGNISQIVADVCRLHHETLDGKGYPLGLMASELSEEVRISTICDVFDALTTIRPYKKPWDQPTAFKWMFDRDHVFDRKLLLSLASALGR